MPLVCQSSAADAVMLGPEVIPPAGHGFGHVIDRFVQGLERQGQRVASHVGAVGERSHLAEQFQQLLLARSVAAQRVHASISSIQCTLCGS